MVFEVEFLGSSSQDRLEVLEQADDTVKAGGMFSPNLDIPEIVHK